MFYIYLLLLQTTTVDLIIFRAYYAIVINISANIKLALLNLTRRNTMNEKDWVRPNKPYVATNLQQPRKKSPPAKKVQVSNKKNLNNAFLLDCMRLEHDVKISINNTLSTDETLKGSYIGRVLSYDDYTILLENKDGKFLINKSAFCMVELV